MSVLDANKSQLTAASSVTAIVEALLERTDVSLCSLAEAGKVEEVALESVSLAITGIAPLDQADKTHLAFINNEKYRAQLSACKAGLVIMSEAFLDAGYRGYALVHENPYWLYAKFACAFQQQRLAPLEPSIAETAVIEAGAVVGEGCSIGHGTIVKAGATVGAGSEIAEHCLIDSNVQLGAGAKISAGAKLLRDCVIGDDVFVDANAVIGSEGFGYAPYQESGSLRWQRIAQLGKVVIGDRASIGASTTIDRGALDDTVIGNDVIIDNQVQVAHNTRIGDGTAIAGCVGIAGSSVIGKRCSIGGGAGIAGHLSIADDTVVLGMTLINKSVKKSGVYASGTGMQAAGQWRKSAVRFTQLDTMHQRIRALEASRAESNE